MECGTNVVDVVLRTPSEREQIAWKAANEAHELVLTGFSVTSAVGWVSRLEESA
jgi:hypothetical protein